MANKSLYDFHLRGLGAKQGGLDKRESQLWKQTMDLNLPPLRLPETAKSNPFTQWIQSWQMGLGVVAMAMIAALVLIPTLQQKQDVFRAKGSISVTVFFERAGEVKPFDGSFSLENGDRIGAQVISSQASIAYWAVTNDEFKVISDQADIESSAIALEPGKSGAFNNSFELTEPNEGEHLVIAVCKKSDNADTRDKSLFDRDFVSRLMKQNKLAAESCMFVGYRLRGKP